MRSRIAKIIIVLSLAFSFGCSSMPQHTNTLIFGTSTKFALDVSVNPTAGGSPDITLGYKRYEGVWMPLLANQSTEDAKNKPPSGSDPKGTTTTDTETTVPGKCGNDDNSDCHFRSSKTSDSYSVLASFGATYGGGAGASPSGTGVQTSTSIKGGLAQFFATGLAAQLLAEKGNARLVSIQPVDEVRLKNAETRNDDLEKQLLQELGSKKFEKAKKEGKKKSSELLNKKTFILSMVAPDNELKKSEWNNIVNKSVFFEDDDKNKETREELNKINDFNTLNDKLNLDAVLSGSLINPLFSSF